MTLARAGCKVAFVGRRVGEGEAVLGSLRKQGATGCVVALDVRDHDSVESGFALVQRTLGDVDIVINNAGIATASPALEVSEEDWLRVIDTNLIGARRVAQSAARMMRDARTGDSIVNIASILGLRVAQQVPAYNATKAGLIHLTRSLALEWARHGIRVNAIAPGYFESDINRDFFPMETGQVLIRRIPQRKLGLPAQLDGALLLLASSASDYMTGTVLPVDGGHAVSSL